MIYKNFKELVGNTPLYAPTNIIKKEGLKANLLVKLELFNPMGSVKDRAALYMVEDAEKQGLLTKGATIIEPTSGNTGIGIAAVAVPKGYKVILTMPETMSKERRDLLSSLGAELVLTDGSLGMTGSINKANELNKTIPNSIILGQFTNPSNVKAHYETTGPEIFKDTLGKVDAFVAGVGTGGTITGVAKYLKEQNQNIKIIAVEPSDSAVLSGEKAGSHKIEGIGAGFIPEILDVKLLDQVIKVTKEDAYKYANMLAKEEGILVGVSSGAALYAATKLSKREEYSGKTIVALLPDTGTRYLSTEMFK